MTRALLALALLASDQRRPGEWSTVWYVRLAWESAPCVWAQTGVSVDDWSSRVSAEKKRDDIMAHGWAWPHVTPGPPLGERGETRVAPGAIRYASVKRMLCRMDLPPQERPPCEFPDGDGPPAP